MKYLCAICNYETDNKSNYNKHLLSKAHCKMENLHDKEYDEKKLICSNCNKTFAHASSYSRHMSYRCTKMRDQLEVLKKEFYEYKKNAETRELELLKKENEELKNLIKSGKLGTTYNLSVKNYVQQNYPDAPALESLANYSQITFEDEDFIGTLVYNYNNNILHKYIGDFLIEHYTKDDPSEQSIWNSDTSRLTYIVKELMSDKKSCWNHDYKGVKTTTRIVSPLLKYIKKTLNDYWMNNIDKFRSMDIKALETMQAKFITIHKIKKDIDDGVLASAVIKYMAPYFYMHRDTENVYRHTEKLKS